MYYMGFMLCCIYIYACTLRARLSLEAQSGSGVCTSYRHPGLYYRIISNYIISTPHHHHNHHQPYLVIEGQIKAAEIEIEIEVESLILNSATNPPPPHPIKFLRWLQTQHPPR